MVFKTEVTIRCYQPEDSVRCHSIFTEGMKGLVMPSMKIVYPDLFKVAVTLLVPVIAIAVKYSLWILLFLYFIAFGIISAITYIYIYVEFMFFINGCLKSDLLDIGKYYEGDSCMFVAECDGRVVGMVGVAKKDHHKPGVAELQRMSVCPSARGKGIGKLLVNKVVEFCKEKGFYKIILSTTNIQPAAVTLYKKCGFKLVITQRYPQYFLYNVKELDFEKDIEASR